MHFMETYYVKKQTKQNNRLIEQKDHCQREGVGRWVRRVTGNTVNDSVTTVYGDRQFVHTAWGAHLMMEISDHYVIHRN